MDTRHDHLAEDVDHPPAPGEADVKASVTRSAAEIADGRSVPLEPALQRLRATADRIRRERTSAEQGSTHEA